MKIELATKNNKSDSELYARFLWNDEEISLPGDEGWTPVENLIRILHAGFLGEEHSLLSIEDSLGTLNSLDELDSIINDTILSVDKIEDKTTPISKL